MCDEEFEAAAEHLTQLVTSKSVKENDLLYLYARYKQSTIGPCNVSKPSFTNISGRRKWQAWKNLENMDSSTAMEEYIEKIKQADPSWEYESNESPNRVQFGVTVSTLNSEMEESLEDNEKTIFDWCREGALTHVKEGYENDKVKDDEGRTLLHWACDRGHLDVVEFLLEKNHDVNCYDTDKLTPLHYAASCDNLEIVKMLIKHGADMSAEDIDGETPVDCAESQTIKNYMKEQVGS